MPKPSLRSSEALVGALERALELARAPAIDPVDLGKALSAIARASRALFVDAGIPSVRMAAAERALDLTTPKSALEAFVGRAPGAT